MASHETNDSPEFLVRARGEILRLMRAMIEAGTRITLSVPQDAGSAPSALIFIDEGSNSLLLEHPAAWPPLAGAAAVEGIMLSCLHEDAKIEFQGGVAIVEDMGGTSVIRVDIPGFLWRFQRRRDPRYPVNGLKMTLNLGFLEAEAEVTNLSQGGIGVVYCEPDVQLQPGEVLAGCAIMLPGVGQIAVDVTVQHQARGKAPDGSEARRLGCSLTGIEPGARQMILRYLDALAA